MKPDDVWAGCILTNGATDWDGRVTWYVAEYAGRPHPELDPAWRWVMGENGRPHQCQAGWSAVQTAAAIVREKGAMASAVVACDRRPVDAAGETDYTRVPDAVVLSMFAVPKLAVQGPDLILPGRLALTTMVEELYGVPEGQGTGGWNHGTPKSE